MTASIDLSSYRDQHFKVSITLYVLIDMHIFNTYFHFKGFTFGTGTLLARFNHALRG